MSKIGRNDPCPCGSGRKYKKCCLEEDMLRKRGMLLEEGISSTTGRGLGTGEETGLGQEIKLGDLFDIKVTEIKDDETRELLLYHIQTGNCPYNKKKCIPPSCPLGEEGIKQCPIH